MMLVYCVRTGRSNLQVLQPAAASKGVEAWAPQAQVSALSAGH